jgi:hypothetical protein
MWRNAHWAYCAPSPLWVYDRRGVPVHQLESANGVRQGDLLAAALFALAVQPIYASALVQVPGASAVAVLDDITFLGTPEQVTQCTEALADAARAANLTLQPRKCKFLWFHDTPLAEPVTDFLQQGHFLVCQTATVLLGAPIGRDEAAIRRMLQDAVDEHGPFFDLLCHNCMPVQIASILLRASGVPRMNFLSRVVAPSLIRDAAAAFDQRVLDTALRFLQIDPARLSDEARLQLSLPIRLGGAGLRTAERTSPFAFWGGLSQAAPYLAAALPHGDVPAGSPLSPMLPPSSSMLPPRPLSCRCCHPLTSFCLCLTSSTLEGPPDSKRAF